MSGFDRLIKDYESIMNVVKNRWMDGVYAKRNEIEQVYQLLSDEDSKRLYISEILFCELTNFLKGDLPSTFAGLMSNGEWNRYTAEARDLDIYNFISVPEGTTIKEYCLAATYILQQYQYKDKVKVEPGDICLDCGACFGETSLWFLSNGAKKTYAFEIDKHNIKCMNENFRNNSTASYSIEPFAVSDINKDVYFLPVSGNVGAGRIVNDEPKHLNKNDYYTVKTVTIDKFCADNQIKPNFIKMDIEGAEISAIKGAIETFKSARPKFAICIYHAWDHRWRIPLLLNSILDDYEFYLKKSHPYHETVLLGRPKS